MNWGNSRYYLISLLLHFLGGSILYNIPVNVKPRDIKEDYVLVELVEQSSIPYLIENPVSFNPSTPLGEETQTTSLTETVSSSDGTSNSEEIGELFKSLEKMAREYYRKQGGGMEILMKSAFYGESLDLDEYFRDIYEEGDRNKVTYDKLFASLASEYFTYFDNRTEIMPILQSNEQVREILGMVFTFDEEGRFKITHIETSSKFKGEYRKVLEHYKRFFNGIVDGKFVSPSICNLKTPYDIVCCLINPLSTSSSENILLQK